MKLLLPELAQTQCKLFGFCGKFDDPAGVPKKEQLLIARKGRGREASFIRLIVGGDEFPGHIHVDYALREYFVEQAPEPDASVKDINDVLSQFAGRQISTANVRAVYHVPQDDLPVLLSASIINFNKDGFSLRTKSGVLAVKGLPIYEIAWSLRPSGTATITLHSRGTGVVDNVLLTEAFEEISKAADIILKGK